MTTPTWTALEARFRALLPAMKFYRLDYQWGSAGEHWYLKGGVSNAATSEFETLATIAGDLVLRLPASAVAPEALAEPKAKHRWYLAVWHHMTYKIPDTMAYEKQGEEVIGHIFGGTIQEPVQLSATLCLQFSTVVIAPRVDGFWGRLWHSYGREIIVGVIVTVIGGVLLALLL